MAYFLHVADQHDVLGLVGIARLAKYAIVHFEQNRLEEEISALNALQGIVWSVHVFKNTR